MTRDRIYVDAMRDVYSNVTKVYVDQKSGSNLLYLPLDKIVAATRAQAKTEADQTVDASLAGTQTGAAQNTAPASGAQTSSTYSGAAYRTEDDPREMIRARTR